MSKDFKQWLKLKENLHNTQKRVLFKERDIFWASIGVNIVFEQDALLVQGRTYDAKRLENKIGMIAKDDFDTLKLSLRRLLNV